MIKVEESQPQHSSPINLGKGCNALKEENTKATKTRKKKGKERHYLGEIMNEEERMKNQMLLAEKETLQEMAIKAYMVPFRRGSMSSA